jgi:hypothetical protein
LGIEAKKKEKRKMMNAIKFGIAALILAACGAGYENQDDNGIDLEGDEVELGSVEQAVNIGTGGDGFANTSGQLRCAQPGGTGQACFIPAAANKTTVSYCFAGFSAAENAPQGIVDFISQGIEQVDGQLGTWKLFPTQFPCDITIQKGALSGSTPIITNFVKMTPGGTLTALTSPAGIAHVNGSWTSFTKLSVVVDSDKMVAQGLPGSQNWFYFGGAIAARYVGLGIQTDQSVGQNYATRKALITVGGPFMFNAGVSPGEVCRADNTTNLNPGTVNAVVGCATF